METTKNQELYRTHDAAIQAGIIAKSPDAARRAFSGTAQRLKLTPADIRKSKRGKPEKFWSEEQIQAVKAYRQTSATRKRKKKSEDEIMDSLFGGAFDASIQNPEPQKDEVIIISDAPIQNSDTGNQDNSEPLPAPAELIPPAVISANVDSDTQADKKITLATADQSTASEEKTAVLNNQQQNITGGGFVQELANLPAEILALPRWIKVGTAANPKEPTTHGWQRAKNQRHYNKIRGKIGFVCSVHKGDRADETREDYMLIDGDHILDPVTDKFVSPKAKRWIEFLLNSLADGEPVFCERSLSKSGVHILCKPTRGKFELAAGDSGTLYFGKHDTKEERKSCPKIELFVGSEGRQVVLTGDLFKCEKGAGIPSGETVDDIIETLINQIQIENKPKTESVTLKETPAEKPKQPPKKFSRYGIAQETIDAVNKISADSIEAKGFISKAPKGHYICPHCGSGTHENASGALATDNNRGFTHWHCHSASCTLDGNNIQLFAEIWKLDISKDFTKIVKRLCDEFGISFEYNAPMNDDQDETIYLRDCIKDAPINLRVPSNFVVSEKYILAKVKSKKDTEGEFRFIPVAQMPIIPTRIFREPSKNFTQYEVQMKIRGHWRTVEIDGAALADARDLAKTLASRGALIDEPTRLRTFFNTIIARNYDMPEIRAFNKPGWQKDGTFIYPTGGDNYICRRNNIDYDELFATKGDAEAWKKKFQDIIRRGGFLHRMIIGMNACAPLLDILELPNFSVHIEGTSNYAKSPLVKFGLSIYGNPTEGQLFRTWDGTAKNRLTMAAGLNDFPQALDEAESMSKRDEEEFAKNVYDFCGGIINQANKRNGDVRQAEKFRGIRISTGERPVLKITDKKGAFKRLITLHVDQPLFSDSEAVDLHRFCARNHGHFGRKWIEYISTHREQIKNDFDIALAKIQDSDIAKGIEETHVRALTACAVALWHFQILLNFEQSFDLYLATADVRLTLRDLPTKDEISDLTRGITLLAAWVTEHPKNFVYETPSEDMPAISFAESSGKVFRDTRVGFSVNAFRRIVEDELHLPSYEKFLNDLYDADKIICKSKREKAKQVKIDKQNVRLYLFKAGVLLSEENDEDEEQEEHA